MRAIISFLILMGVKTFSHIFYKLDLKWLSKEQNNFEEVRLIILLHHTSLYEPLFVSAAPTWFIWRIARKVIMPVADKTVNRMLVGKLFKFMLPGLIPISRKRDATWKRFKEAVKQRPVILIAPEGRMKRNTGLDSEGKAMTVRSGVAEIIEELYEGKIMIAYSGGLHHVQHPGELIPRLFKTIKLNLEVIPVNKYKSQFESTGIQFRRDVVADLEQRLKTKCPID